MRLFEGLDLRLAEAKFLAAFLYARGLGVDRNLEMAHTLLREASDAGLPSAQCLLAWLIQSDQIRNEPKSLVAHLYVKAAEGNHAAAAFNLGNLYERGELVTKDLAEAVRWYTVAANLGNSTAAVRLGELYEDGQLLPRDESSALAWYQRAVALGDVAGHMNLARIFLKGDLGVKGDPEKAAALDKRAQELRQTSELEQLRVLREAALHGDKQSQEILAMVYQSGSLGVAISPKKAEYWRKKAREIVSDI